MKTLTYQTWIYIFLVPVRVKTNSEYKYFSFTLVDIKLVHEPTVLYKMKNYKMCIINEHVITLIYPAACTIFKHPKSPVADEQMSTVIKISGFFLVLSLSDLFSFSVLLFDCKSTTKKPVFSNL